MLTPLLAVAAALAGAEPSRVAAARKEKLDVVKSAFAAAKVIYPPTEIFLRVFKTEKRVELWAGNSGGALALIKQYPICAQSGVLGPKREEGDSQVPEGVYTIDRVNPWSSYHLALHVDYPNAADRARGKVAGRKKLGGDIMVHGNCVTIGCVPIEDDPIKELFLAVWDTRERNGEKTGWRIPIHIFPRALDDASLVALLESDAPADAKALWQELAPIYRAFESTHNVPRVKIDAAGRHTVEIRGMR